MRAIIQDRFGGPEVLHIAEVEKPTAIPTEVLVRVHAAGVNPVDWKTRAHGGMSHVLGQLPIVPGWDVSGVVVEIGGGVTRFKPGDEVFGMIRFPHQGGAYAEYATAPSRQFAFKPKNISHIQAAGVPLAALTAWQLLVDTINVQPGQRVLVHAAAGGVGHFAVQIAKARGAYVIGTARAEKHPFLAEIGVDQAIDYTAGPFEDAVSDVDIVVDLIGGQNSVRSIKTLRSGGILAPVPGGAEQEVDEEAANAGIEVVKILVEPDGCSLTEIAKLIQDGKVVPSIGLVLPLEEAAKAHEMGEQGRSTGKIVLSVV